MVERRLAVDELCDAQTISNTSLHRLDERSSTGPSLAELLAIADKQIEQGQVRIWNAELRAEIWQRAREKVRVGSRPKPEVCP